MSIKLSPPQIADEKDYYEMIDEFRKNNEPIIPKAIESEEDESFKDFIQRKIDRHEWKDLPNWYVPDSLFFIKDDNGKIVGWLNIRHELNDFLREFWGHIGYWIKPSERKKWYATEGLKLGLQECRKIGINEIILTCKKENISSAKVIENNGGIFDKEFIKDNIINQRWIISLV